MYVATALYCHFISQRTKSLFMRAREVVYGIGESVISGWCGKKSGLEQEYWTCGIIVGY